MRCKAVLSGLWGSAEGRLTSLCSLNSLCLVAAGDEFRLGYLTKQSAAWAVLGVNFGSKFQPSDLVKPSDKMFVVAYPSFNPRGKSWSSTRRLSIGAAVFLARCVHGQQYSQPPASYTMIAICTFTAS